MIDVGNTWFRYTQTICLGLEQSRFVYKFACQYGLIAETISACYRLQATGYRDRREVRSCRSGPPGLPSEYFERSPENNFYSDPKYLQEWTSQAREKPT